MENQPYVPVGMSDAEVALLRQARQYRGAAVLDDDAADTQPEPTTGQIAWNMVRTKLRRTVIGKPAAKKPAKKSGKKSAKARVGFVRGGALAAAIVSLMFMPMFGVLSSVVAIAISGRAILRGQLRGVMLLAMVFVQLLAWALLFRVA